MAFQDISTPAREAGDASAERRLRFARFSLEVLQDAHFWVRPDGLIVDANEAACRSLQLTRDELLTLTVSDIDPSVAKSRWRAIWDRVRQSPQAVVFESVHRRKDGSEFPVEIRAHFFEFEGEEYHFSAVRDISERKRGEAALKESRARFRDFTYASSDWFWEMDAGSRFTFLSERFESETGISPQRVIGRTRFEIGRDDSGDAKWTRHEEDLTARRPFKDFVCRATDDAANEVWMSVSGVPVFDEEGGFAGYRGTGRRVTHEVRARWEIERLSRRNALILNAMSEGICGVDGAGHIVFANRTAAELLGCNIADMLGRAFHDTFHKPGEECCLDGQAVCFLAKALNDGQPRAASEETLYRRDGVAVPVELACTRLRDSDGGLSLVIVFRDITWRRQSEASLRKLSVAVEQSPAAIVITATDGTIEYVNKAFEAVTGYTAAEAVGENPRILAAGRTPVHEYQRLWRTLAMGEKWTGEFLNRRKDGTLFWEAAVISPVTDAAGRATHYIAIKSDITHRKRAEAQVKQSFGVQRASNRMLRIAQLPWSLAKKFENMMDVALTLDWVTFQARAALFLATRRSRDLAASATYNLESEAALITDAIDPGAAGYAELFEVGGVRYLGPNLTEQTPYWNDSQPSGRYEAPLTIDGAAAGLLVIAAPRDHVPTADHENFLKSMADILAMTVERERNTAELVDHRDHLQNLVDAATLELRGKTAELEFALSKEKELNALQRQFVSMASHEFRTPLAIIDSTAQRIGRRYPRGISDEDLNERLRRIRGAVARMTELIDSTLSAARLDAGKIKITPTECAIRDRLSEVCDQQRQITPDRSIAVDVDRLPARIVADPNAIDQIFVNLLSNAVKYSPDGGPVEVVGRTDGEVIRVAVRDHGLGIPEDELPRLFERFFRARTSTGISGTGIGLHLVKELAEMHGGTVTVSSVEGEGSTFVVSLPIEPAAPKGKPEAAGAACLAAAEA